MQPEIDLFGFSLKTFGLMLACAFLACGLVAARRLEELGRPREWAYEMVLAAAIGGIVGSRVYWVIEHWSEAKDDLLGNLFGGTGLVFYGGVIGGALFVLAWAWWRGVFDLRSVDMAAVPLAIGYSIGRIGCQLSGDGDYGKAWDGPWAMAYPHGTVPTTQTVHPTPIYETLVMGLVAWGLWRARDAVRPGALFALWLVCAGVERFFIEFLRRNPESWLGLTTPQLESVAMIIGGVAWLAVMARRGGVRVARPGGIGRAVAVSR